jgi:hypothetical protein
MVVFMAAAASIVLMDTKEATAVVERYLKSKSSSEDEATMVHYDDLPKTKDSFAPIFLQDKTGTHPTALFMKKYGMTQSKKAKSKKPSTFGKTAVKGQDSESTWIYGRVTQGEDCGEDAREYYVGGMKANTCIPIDGTSAVMFTCDSSDIQSYTYATADCSGSVVTASTVAQTGCQLPINTPWGAYTDDDKYADSVNLSCVSGDSVAGPVIGEYHYDVQTMYTTTDCQQSSYYYFEGYTSDFCIPFSLYEGEANAAAVFKYGGDGKYQGIYAKLYAADKNCYGAKTKAIMPSGCQAGT